MINIIASLFIGTILLFTPAAAHAESAQPTRQFAACGTQIDWLLGLEPWWSCLEKKYGDGDGIAEQGTDARNNEIRIGALNDFWLVVLVILEDVIKVGGYIAVGFIIWGGIKYSKSQGNPGEIQQAQSVIKNAILGLVITLISVAIVEFVVRGLTG